MSEGIFYVIGGVKGGGIIKQTVTTLASRFTAPVSVLYLGAAHDEDIGFESSFQRALKDEVSSNALDLKIMRFSNQAGDLEQKFLDANVVFFDGGNISSLEKLFRISNLKSLCENAFKRGACVGGLCAGGSFFGSTVVHSNVDEDLLRVNQGVGLIPDTTITCYIGDQDQRNRLEILENEAFKRKETGLGVPINQAVTWNSKQGFQKLFSDKMGPVIYRYP